MKAPPASENRHHRLRDAYRRQIAELGPFIEGTLSSVKRPGRVPRAWQLTFKLQGKTHTVYVPRDLAQEVQRWAREYRRLKTLIRKVTGQSLAIIRGHVAVRRAVSRGRPSRSGASPSTSRRLRASASRT